MCEFLTVEQWQQRIEDNSGSAFGIPYNFTPCPEDEEPNTEGRQFVVEPQPPGQYILIVRGINEAGHFRDPPEFSSIFVHQAPDTTAPRTDA
jgi:hypothetical protein